MNQNKKMYKFGIKQKTTIFIIFPCMMICLFTCIYAIFSYRNLIRDEVEEKLHTAAYGATIISQSLGMKADNMINQINEYSDETGVEITIFNENVRAVSSIEGATGSKMNIDIENDLIQKETAVFYTNADVNGESYYGYYIPWVSDGKLIGAVFSGIPRQEAINTIFVKVRNLVFSILAITAFFVFIASSNIKKILKKLDIAFDYTENLNDNNLAVESNALIGKDTDEVLQIEFMRLLITSKILCLISEIHQKNLLIFQMNSVKMLKQLIRQQLK